MREINLWPSVVNVLGIMQQKKRKMRTPREEIGVNKLVFESPQGTTFFCAADFYLQHAWAINWALQETKVMKTFR